MIYEQPLRPANSCRQGCSSLPGWRLVVKVMGLVTLLVVSVIVLVRCS